MRVALGIEYCGAQFCGWQTQPAGCGAQDAIERALAAVAAAPIKTHCAGRTDAGAHATMQIAHFDSEAPRQPSAWMRGVNAALPPSCRVVWARRVGFDFHARHRAHWRRYQYLLLNRAVGPGLFWRFCGWHHAPLDIDAMRAAAAPLAGAHDFSTFRAASCQAAHARRRMIEIEITRAREWILFDFRADGFLHHMARNLVAALIVVGRGKKPPLWIAEILRKKDRALAAPTASAAGLYFVGAGYGQSRNLPATEKPLAAPFFASSASSAA